MSDSPSPLCEANLLALTGEESLEDIRELTLRNHKLQTVDTGDVARLINLQVMSLSHNLLTSLAGFQHLKSLVSLNLNNNALTSLEGIEHCSALQHFFVANNRVRDPSPLVACTQLQTLHLFRNNIANLELAITALSHLPRLRELELAGNPCALAPEYKHRLVLHLELETLDGDTINQLDYDLANDYFALHGGAPELGPRVDILTLEDAEPSGSGSGAAAATTAPDAHPAPGLGGSSGSADGSGLTSAEAAAAATGPSGVPRTATLANGRPTTAAIDAIAATTAARMAGGSASATSSSRSLLSTGPSGGAPPPPPYALLPRPGTAGFRPGTAAARPGTALRPGSAYSGLQTSVQLLSNELLNDHPLIIEYLAKHVLQEGLALTAEGGGGSSGPGRPGSGGGGGARGPSFAQRLRDTAAAMNACEDMDAKALAGQGMELVATSSTVRRGMAEEMVASASPHELVRQLVRLSEVLIKEVEAHRNGLAARPPSGGASSGGGGRPGTASGIPRPGTAAGQRPGTAAGQPSSATTVASNTLSQAEIGELVTLRAEVERLCRENKALRIENENMFWLAEEIKRLKAELKEARAQGGQK